MTDLKNTPAAPALIWERVVGDVEVSGAYKIDRMAPWFAGRPKKYFVRVFSAAGCETIGTLLNSPDEAKAIAQTHFDERYVTRTNAESEILKAQRAAEAYAAGLVAHEREIAQKQLSEVVDRLADDDASAKEAALNIVRANPDQWFDCPPPPKYIVDPSSDVEDVSDCGYASANEVLP